ncbi:hypothetical protein MITS9504_02188 [Synechococcus sp. MIT S9504]|nr:hypothetical protein MITS9504_02188 [Synechococcus sp. MIT S9504]
MGKMTRQIDNRVVLICSSDESSWRPNGIKGVPIGSYSIGIDPITKKIRSERLPESCLHSFSHNDNGTLIELSSEGTGVIAIDTIELPRSTLAVVRLISNQQGHDIHMVEGVKAEDLSAYNWSLEGKEKFQLYKDPSPPARWKGDLNEWRRSALYRSHQQGFDRQLEQEFASAVRALSIHITPDHQKVFNAFITRACADNTGLFWDIRKAAAVYALQGSFCQNDLNRMVYLAQEGIAPQELSFQCTAQQFIKALFDHCKQTSEALSDEQIWDAQTRCDLLTLEQLLPIVRTKSKYKPFLYRWLWRLDGKPDPSLIENPDLYEIYREDLIADRDKIMAAFGIDGALEVDYRDQVINSMLRDDGWTLVETDTHLDNEYKGQSLHEESEELESE